MVLAFGWKDCEDVSFAGGTAVGRKDVEGVGFAVSTAVGESVGPSLGSGVFLNVGLHVSIGFFSRPASFVLIAATAARNRNQRGAACFMVLDCWCDVNLFFADF